MSPHMEVNLFAATVGPLYKDYRNLTLINPHIKVSTRDAAITVDRLVLHCTDKEGWTPERLSRFAIEERQFSICSYHYYIQPDTIWHMVGHNVITPHAAPFNKHSLAVSMDFAATNWESLKIPINPDTYHNAITTLAYLALLFGVRPVKIVGHRELPGTGFFMKQDIKVLRKTCPGLTIDMKMVRFLVTKKIQETLNSLAIEKPLAVDGVFGPKTSLLMDKLLTR